MQKNLTFERIDAANIGQEIGKELGQEMIQNFQLAHPSEIAGYEIGRVILEQILNQPLCSGLKVYNAINKQGENTLVLVGMDKNSQPLLAYTVVGENGLYESRPGIVADRIKPGRPGGLADSDSTDWGWTID